HRGEQVGRGVVGVGEAEVGGADGLGRVLQGGDRAVGAGGGVVDRGDVGGEGVGGLVQVHARVGRAPVVTDLEGGRAAGRAGGVGRGVEDQLVGVQVGLGDLGAGGHGVVVQGQGARRGQGGDDHRGEQVGRGVVGVGEAEVGGADGLGRVLQGGDRAVGAGGGVVDRGDVGGEGVGGLVQVHARVGRAPVVTDL